MAPILIVIPVSAPPSEGGTGDVAGAGFEYKEELENLRATLCTLW